MLIVTPGRTAALVYENFINFAVVKMDDGNYKLDYSAVDGAYWSPIVRGTEEYVRAAFEKIIMGAERNLRVVYL